MTVNFNGVIRVVGLLLLVLGVCLFPSLIVSLIYDETTATTGFLMTLIPCILLGLILIKLFRPSLLRLKARDGFLIVSLCWILASLIGSLPLILSGTVSNYMDAFFEICSGFSTTGSTILTDVEALPKSILFWRSFTHWLGGMGIIVLAMALLPSVGIGGQLVANAETPGPIRDKVAPRFADAAKKLYWVYLIFTATETLLLLAGGMNLYDALIHTFGTVGTGGFSSYNNSMAHFSSPFLQWVVIFFMTLCGINFNLYFVLAKHGLRAMLKNSELKLYLLLIAGASLLIITDLLTYDIYHSGKECVRNSVFQVTSVITTTGYATCDYDSWPTFSRMLIFLLMLTGACSSSTGGGVKLIRILIALKLIKRGVSLKLHPNRIAPVTLNKKELPKEIVTNVTNFIFLYIFIIFVASLLIAFNGFDLITTVSSVVTCLGNIGPGFNLVGPDMNFSQFSDFSKLIFSLLMIAGRLELFTFFMLLSPHYWNANKA